ncbi:hypothetical protein JFJ08_14990 [Vibrio atlanticus]|nr:hypothetical protein [Vibrio atlanticus]
MKFIFRDLKDFARHSLLKKMYFEKIHSYKLNMEKPESFSEKIFYRKTYGNFNSMANIADKIKVRDYVEKKIGAEYLINMIGTFNHLSVEDIESLPKSFVMKTNHGSGAQHVEVVENKFEISASEIVDKFNNAILKDKGRFDEKFYSYIERKILVETYLKSESKTPNDYKFHCFNDGTIYIQVDSNRYEGHSRAFFDLEWRPVDIKIKSSIKKAESISKPDNFDLMLELARKLSEDFDYIRVDLYNINGKIYFGELTQTHGGGIEAFSSVESDFKWGQHWKLERENKWLYRK